MSTFGLETMGGSDHAITANYHFLNRKQASFTGIIYSVGAYIKNAAVNEEFRITIYDDNTGSPDNFLGCTPMLLGTGVDGWFTSELNMPIAVTNSSYYWIGIHTDDDLTVTYDVGSEDYEVASDAFHYPEQPWVPGSGGSSREYALYFNTEFLVSTDRWIGFKERFYKTYTLNFDEYGAGPDGMLLQKMTAVENLTLTKMWAYTTNDFVTGSYARGVIYSDDTGSPDALLGQTDPVQGATTEQWYSAELQSTVDIVVGTDYWIGWQADNNMVYMNAPWGWIRHIVLYDVADTYSDGPANPCNSPSDYDDLDGMSYYAEGALTVLGITADANIFGEQVNGITAKAVITNSYTLQSGITLVL